MMQNAYLYIVYQVIYYFIAIIQLWHAKIPMAYKFSMEYFSRIAGISLSVHVSVSVQNAIDFVLWTPPRVLLLLYWKFVDTLIIYWSCGRCSYLHLNYFVKYPVSVKPLAGVLTLCLTCQFWALPIQQQIKIWCLKYWQMGDTIFWLSRKYCGKRRNFSWRATSSFPTMFPKAVYCWC